MKSPTTAAVAVVLLLAGCVGTTTPATDASNAPGADAAGAPATEAASANRITELEQKVETLERRVDDYSRKGRIISSVFGSPIDNFFAEEGWWENPFDVGQGECSNGCIQTLQEHRRACAENTDANARLACYDEAVANASRCHRQCQAQFPPARQ